MAKKLMIQGTMSGAGKSILTAGILRVMKQDGFKVAPFKAQNMSSNTFVTADGLQMAASQAVQARAAGIKPSVLMNPILLKPTGESTSDVILNGKSIGKMPASEYFKEKKSLIPEIKKAYKELEKDADIIVIEGAGSPAEINLKENDIVNMGLAKMLNAPVILVGNIDVGGVFAQILGTGMLLTDEERKLVKGYIINKFRGDIGLLMPGIEMFKEHCDLSYLGTMPYVEHSIMDEDSLVYGSDAVHKFDSYEAEEESFNTLADIIRKNLNIEEIYRMM